VNSSQLLVVMPKAPMAWLIALAEEMPRWNIDTPAREAAFVGQVAHESAGLTKLEEGLDYSAGRILAVWPQRFADLNEATRYAHHPVALASKVYAGRMGNGDEKSGEGYMYRGRGPIQLTGKDAYREYGTALNADLVSDPDALIRVPRLGCAAACRFFLVKGCNELADAGDIAAITRKVNGGDNGLDDRIHLTAAALKVMAT
jgi:putative chitinase